MNFENNAFSKTLQQPYFQKVVSQYGMLLSNYNAVTHPSQPNYITQIAGDYFKLANDSNVVYNVNNVVDLLEAKQISWKSYQENYPLRNETSKGWNANGCFEGTISSDKMYWRKHNPFLSMKNVLESGNRCKNIVNSQQLWNDIQNQQLPQYMYYTPNINNDAHNTDLKFANNYLQHFLEPLLQNSYFMRNTLIVITFDEDDYSENNHIYTALISDVMKPTSVGQKDTNPYNHYSLLKTVEENWQLGSLHRNDEQAIPFQCIQ